MALAASVLTGCGGGDGGAEARAVLDDVTTSAAASKAATLSLRVAVFGNDPESDLAHRAGFELISAFDTTAGRRLPVTSLTYSVLQGEQVLPWEFRSTGDLAYVERDGAAFQVPEGGEAQVVALAGALSHLGDLKAWFGDVHAEDRGQLLGITGDADGVGTLRAVFALGAAVDAANVLPDPDAVSDDVLAEAVDSGTVSVRASSANHDLRRLDATIVLDAAPFPEVAALVGGASALRLEVELSVHALSAPLEVPAPADLRPWEELPPAVG